MQSLVTERLTTTASQVLAQKKSSINHWIVLGVVVGFFFALQLGWLMMDSQSPDMDESNHILSSIQISEYLRKPRPFKLDWWQQCITVNAFYPPAVYAFNGVIRSFLGTANWVNLASIGFFNLMLSLSVYGSTRLISNSKTAAILAIALVNLYPGVVTMNHTFLLDYPLISMVSVAIFCMLWWNQAPSWGRAAICGLLCGFACTTKQIAPAFIAGPGLYLFVSHTIQALKGNQPKSRPLQLMVGLSGSLAMFAIWYLLSASAVQGLASHNVEHIGSRSLATYFSENLWFYLSGAPRVMSPLLFGLFLVSVLAIKPEQHRKLIPVGLSAVIGLAMVCCIGWAMPLDRYQAPALIAVGIYTAIGLAALVASRNMLIKAGSIAVLALAVVQLISFEFCPYPISQPVVLTKLSEWLGVQVKGYRTVYPKDNPGVAGQDWGQKWIIQTIESVDSKNGCWLNLQVNSSELNPHTLELYAKQMHSNVRPTSSRVWTVKGDKQTFDEKQALYYQWYLLKSAVLGNPFQDEKDRQSTEQLLKFVTTSGHFRMVADKKMPDGSTIALYRQK